MSFALMEKLDASAPSTLKTMASVWGGRMKRLELVVVWSPLNPCVCVGGRGRGKGWGVEVGVICVHLYGTCMCYNLESRAGIDSLM